MAISGPGKGISLLTFPLDGALGEVLTVTGVNPFTYEWQPGGGGGGGQVNTVVGGVNITVDAADPVNPIVNLDAALVGVSVNGVTLTTGGVAGNFLNEQGNYVAIPGGGQVNSVVGGTNITVDAADPVNPIVNLNASIAGVTVNGVILSSGGLATNYLNETGTYTDPLASVIFGTEALISENLVQAITTLTPSIPNNILAGTFPVVHNSLVIPAVPSGQYLLQWNYSWNKDDTPSDFLARMNIVGLGLTGFHRETPADSLGAGNPDAPPGSGTDQRFWTTSEIILDTFTGGVTASLEFASGLGGTEATMIQSIIKFWRIA